MICHIFFYEYILWKILLSKRENCSSYTDNNIHSNLFDLEKRLDNIYLPNEYSIPSGKFSETLKSKLIEFPKMKCLKNKIKEPYEINIPIEINSRTHKAAGYIPYLGNRIE